MNYSELPDALWGRLAPLFDARESDLASLQQIAGPGQPQQPGDAENFA